MSSQLGVPAEKIRALHDYATSPFYTEAERTALEYADAMTLSGREVTDELFARLRRFHDDDAIVELTMLIAWENASTKFNRALRVPGQGLWEATLRRAGHMEPAAGAPAGATGPGSPA